MILDFFDELNWAAVVVAWLAAFVIGFVWYLPPVLGGHWAAHVTRYTGVSAEELMGGSPVQPVVTWLVTMFANAVVLGLLVEVVGANSAGDGLVLGIIVWLGFGATFSLWPVIFARQPRGALDRQQRRVPAHAGRDGRHPRCVELGDLAASNNRPPLTHPASIARMTVSRSSSGFDISVTAAGRPSAGACTGSGGA